MIYLGFIFDYTINTFLPIKTYFITANITNNKLSEVIIIGLIIDILYYHLPFNTIILILLYLTSKKILIRRKYRYLKNILIFTIYFLISNLPYYNITLISTYITSLIIQLIFIKISNLLLNNNYQHIM